MSMHETHLIMYGVKLTFEEGVKLFYGSDDNRDNNELAMDLDGAVIEKPFRMHKPLKDGRNVFQVPVVLVDDVMDQEYFMAGRVIDYAQVEEGESLAFTQFPSQSRPHIKHPLTTEQKRETIDVLLQCGVTDAQIQEGLTCYVFTHVA